MQWATEGTHLLRKIRNVCIFYFHCPLQEDVGVNLHVCYLRAAKNVANAYKRISCTWNFHRYRTYRHFCTQIPYIHFRERGDLHC